MSRDALIEEGNRHSNGGSLAAYYETVLAPENADVQYANAGVGAYVEDPSAGKESDVWYAVAGMGRSPVGAYYETDESIGSYYETGEGMGLYYESPAKYPGMGAAEWSPGAGERPADDPRIVRKFARVTSTYAPRNISGDQTTRVADMLVQEAMRRFPGHKVKKLGTTGWTSSDHPAGPGQVGFEIVLAEEMRAGKVRERFFEIGQAVGPRVGEGTSLYNARTFFRPGDLSMPDLEKQAEVAAKEEREDLTKPPPTAAPAAAEEEEGFFTKEVAGLPVWLIGVLGVGAVGGVAYLTMRNRGGAEAAGEVTANRRRRRRRSRPRRNRRSKR